MASVAVLGGGIGGLSAAHELAKRGFDVTVYEARKELGGKARSMPVPNTGMDGRADLPGEHGFRFFPGFYRHLDATMEEIPYASGCVKDNLTQATEMLLAQSHGSSNEILAPLKFPSSPGDVVKMIRFFRMIAFDLAIPLAEYAAFVERVLAFLTSCDERRLAEFERQSWWDFLDADHRSAQFQKFLAKGMTRSLVAARAEEMSARTGAAILTQLVQDQAQVDGKVDRVLDGPTSEVWIDPWVRYLATPPAEQPWRAAVTFRCGHPVTAIQCDGRDITGVTVEGIPGTVTADYYVAAVPVEKLVRLLTTQLRAAEPRLGYLHRLTTRWMTGAMYYFDVPLTAFPPGHAIYIDSEWALTSIAQGQFWRDFPLADRGDGRVRDVLSVDISDWDTCSKRLGKPARQCTEEEILDEVWEQLLDHLDHGELEEKHLLSRFLDPAIDFRDPGKLANDEPLLINTKRSWRYRPDATTRIPNFFLASDFVRGNTDLATMEGANEAARNAVNGILAKEGRPATDRCPTFRLVEPALLRPLRYVDEVLWRSGRRRPKRPAFATDASGRVEGTNPLSWFVARGLRAVDAVLPG
ncbi:hydroxysqualene dehydroxylase [Mycolicibacterium lacusdiani]|uniref:hydroxysqualene dehydroxylase n=1 Tax=Mycolicibacterium lacusdiani TaxID=2895283 RepID=UPI001F2391D7|nr:FAD-dependent oxidoreductase [Mycolicibacterium lacusdiani]